MDSIRLRDIIVYGYYGASDPERQIGQRLLMDLDLSVDLSQAAATDPSADTVSYEEIYVAAQQLAGGTRCRLLEHLAQQVIDGLFHRFPRLGGVGVSLRKMNLPFPNTCREVEVRLFRERGSGGAAGVSAAVALSLGSNLGRPPGAAGGGPARARGRAGQGPAREPRSTRRAAVEVGEPQPAFLNLCAVGDCAARPSAAAGRLPGAGARGRPPGAAARAARACWTSTCSTTTACMDAGLR